MASNKRELKAFVRFDASGRIIPSSLVLRKKKPKNGRWTEITGYQCCNFTTTTTSTTSTTTTAPSDMRLKANISFTGRFIAGLPEYTWTWNEKAIALGLAYAPTIGVLAQEAMILYPQFVSKDPVAGYLRVNIDAIRAMA